ncbi:drebrin [Latimeria chalumnae]|uniref:drebrin n=1 Tax=Latimeria chalumnae TaxID=7897 RepID=UPI0003C128D1|nr:PREDICTED: drebrin [Latimeria chalumnae]|eukprot:XP_005992436.1 PREDICTED: drebrin [Latimeria chalumnae]
MLREKSRRMAVNLSKNRLALLAAYQDVINEKSSTDWALFTYEEDSNDLKVAGSGGGGLQEITGCFDNQSVMYGFCSIKDPSTILPRYILVNWVGEDVADARKCACASHVATIAEFFQGVDTVVNASSLEDIEPCTISQQSTNGTIGVSSPVLQRLRLREEDAEPVGTTYQKTDAAIEMKRINREQFWEQATKEEEMRKEEERKRAQEERQKFEQERMEQEKREQEEREKKYKERELQIEEQRRKQQSLEAEEAQQRMKEKSIFANQEEEDGQAKKIESEVEEAAAIIAQRPENPREFFKQQEKAVTGSFDSSPNFFKTVSQVDSDCKVAIHTTSDSSVTTPIYEESEDIIEEETSDSQKKDFTLINTEDDLSFQIQQKEAISVHSEEKEAAFESENPSSKYIEDLSYEHHKESAELLEEPYLTYTDESSYQQPQKIIQTYFQNEDPELLQTESSFAHNKDLESMETKAPSPHAKEFIQMDTASLVKLEENVEVCKQESVQQSSVNLVDLWESDGICEPPSAPMGTELISGQLHETMPALVEFAESPQLPMGFQEPPIKEMGTVNIGLGQEQSDLCSGLVDDNLLNFDDLPEPPSSFCDVDQEENPPNIIDIEGPYQIMLSYEQTLQEGSSSHNIEARLGELQDPHLMTNGETPQKEGTQASEGYFSQSQDEEFTHTDESSAKVLPPPVFYNKPPEIDITCWDTDPVAEEEYGGTD